MSYLDPRGASTPGDRPSERDVPAPFAFGVPGTESPDPYAEYRRATGTTGDRRRPASLDDVALGGSEPGGGSSGRPDRNGGAGWDRDQPEPSYGGDRGWPETGNGWPNGDAAHSGDGWRDGDAPRSGDGWRDGGATRSGDGWPDEDNWARDKRGWTDAAGTWADGGPDDGWAPDGGDAGGAGPTGGGRPVTAQTAYPEGPGWNEPTATTGATQGEDVAGPRGKGKRRATRSSGSRAGRNLPAAIAVGVSLGLVVWASLFVWPQAFLGVIALAASVGIWEMVRALRASGANAPVVPLIAGGLVITGLAWYRGPDAQILGLAATILAAVVWRIADGRAALRRDLTASVLIAVYVPFLLGFGVLLNAQPDGALRVIATVLAVALSDTGGYAAGVFYGKHKMAPSISPGKTWEGFGGSVAAAALGSALFLYFALGVPAYYGLLFGAVIAPVAVLGDLAESMLKRDLAVKDMSNLLPGHGGLMDRLDSILFAVPTAYLLLSLIASPT